MPLQPARSHFWALGERYRNLAGPANIRPNRSAQVSASAFFARRSAGL